MGAAISSSVAPNASAKLDLRYTCNSDNQYLSSSKPNGTEPEYHLSICKSSNSVTSWSNFFSFFILEAEDDIEYFLGEDEGDPVEIPKDAGVLKDAGVASSSSSLQYSNEESTNRSNVRR
jgi:hypothetical protein